MEVTGNIPVQMNGADCGVFICQYAEYWSRRAKMNFQEKDMTYFRKQMIYEISVQQLLHNSLICLECSTTAIPSQGIKRAGRIKKNNGPAYQCADCCFWFHVACMPQDHRGPLSGKAAQNTIYQCNLCRTSLDVVHIEIAVK